jgi:hypothetical protein
MEMAAETLPTPDRWTSLLIPIRLAFHRTSALHNRLHYRSAGSALPTLRIGRSINAEHLYRVTRRGIRPTNILAGPHDAVRRTLSTDPSCSHLGRPSKSAQSTDAVDTDLMESAIGWNVVDTCFDLKRRHPHPGLAVTQSNRLCRSRLLPDHL